MAQHVSILPGVLYPQPDYTLCGDGTCFHIRGIRLPLCGRGRAPDHHATRPRSRWHVAQHPYPDGAITDPQGAVSGSNRVVRGGGWGHVASYCRAAFRRGTDPGVSYDGVGFRVARSSVP
jgi:hypothetical protein